MIALVKDLLAHAEKKKKHYWGKDVDIYRFYDAQAIGCRDLLIKHREKKGKERA